MNEVKSMSDTSGRQHEEPCARALRDYLTQRLGFAAGEVRLEKSETPDYWLYVRGKMFTCEVTSAHLTHGELKTGREWSRSNPAQNNPHFKAALGKLATDIERKITFDASGHYIFSVPTHEKGSRKKIMEAAVRFIEQTQDEERVGPRDLLKSGRRALSGFKLNNPKFSVECLPPPVFFWEGQQLLPDLRNAVEAKAKKLAHLTAPKILLIYNRTLDLAHDQARAFLLENGYDQVFHAVALVYPESPGCVFIHPERPGQALFA